MAEPKTQRNKSSVAAFLNAIEDPDRRRDAKTVHKLMKNLTGERPAMWGTSIVGYGSHTYKYADGREGEWMLTGFSPRKQALTLYIMSGIKSGDPLLKKLGKHRTGKACLYINKLDDVELDVLEKLIQRSIKAKKSC